MNKRYRLIVFDWEGTLGEDTLHQVFSTLALEVERLKIGSFDQEAARQLIGLGLPRAINKLFPELSRHQYDSLLHSVQNTLMSSAVGSMLMPGALALVQQLHKLGYDLAIATNKSEQGLLRALQESGLAPYFSVTRSATQSPAKPCPQMLEEIMQVLDVSSDDTLMIGDSISDVEMALAMGVDVIGVDFNAVNRDELLAAGAQCVFDDFQQIAQYLQLPSGG